MSGEKGSGENSSSGPHKAPEGEIFSFNPLPPSITSTLFDPKKWDGSLTRHVGIVMEKSKPDDPQRWVKIHSPTLSTTFFAQGKALKLPLYSMVTGAQSAPLFLDNQRQLMLTNVRPLARANVVDDNRGAYGSRAQTWCKGSIKINRFGKGFYAIEVTGPRGPRSGRLLPFDPSTLLPGSQVLPPDTPALFQTSYIMGQNPYSNCKPEVISVTYDYSEYAKQAGIMPSFQMLDELECKVGTAHLVFGLSPAIDPRGISILDLVELDNEPLDRTNMVSLVKRGLKVLKKRQVRLMRLAENDESSALALEIRAINHSLNEHRIVDNVKELLTM